MAMTIHKKGEERRSKADLENAQAKGLGSPRPEGEGNPYIRIQD
jgi:hypothetical protein